LSDAAVRFGSSSHCRRTRGPHPIGSGTARPEIFKITLERCLIPGFDGALFSREWKDALRDRFFTGCATTTEAIRRAIQNSQESLRALSKQYGINPKTVAKWKQRGSVNDLPTGPKEPKSTSLSLEDEAIIVAFRQHTLLAMDDCLYAPQATIPHLTRSSLHRCLQRHGISRLPDLEVPLAKRVPTQRRGE
jgi:hypothetical protein